MRRFLYIGCGSLPDHHTGKHDGGDHGGDDHTNCRERIHLHFSEDLGGACNLRLPILTTLLSNILLEPLRPCRGLLREFSVPLVNQTARLNIQKPVIWSTVPMRPV